MARTHIEETGYEVIEANGMRFAYFSEGQGPLVLLLHGFPDTPHTWDAIRPAIAAAGYRAVSPFMRGYAPSGIPAVDTNSITLGRDVLALLDGLGGGHGIVVGHDWGADAAYAAANLGPEKVDKLVTVAIPYPAGLRPTLGILWALRHFVTLRLPGAMGRFPRNDFEVVDELVRRWSPPGVVADLEPVKNAFSAPGCANAAVGYYRGALLPPPRALRQTLPMPTLSVGGADDPNVPVALYEAVRHKFAGEYRVATIPGGHFCHRESPAAFVEVLLDFLRQAPR